MHWSFILRKLTWTGKWTSSKGLGYLGSVWLLSASPLYDTHTVHLKRCTVCTPGWIKGELGALCGLWPLVLHRKNRLMDYWPFVLICPCRFYLLLVEITTQLMFQGILWLSFPSTMEITTQFMYYYIIKITVSYNVTTASPFPFCLIMFVVCLNLCGMCLASIWKRFLSLFYIDHIVFLLVPVLLLSYWPCCDQEEKNGRQ